ncbi:MAG: tail fiber domain-containing protein, partial [Bacteriovorax sp.]|nr:tail fiber domain-containing protein [Bacteriovorax sp.]
NYERMRIDSSGNVGIGTTTSTGPLTVYSNSTLTGPTNFYTTDSNDVFSILPHAGVTYLSSGTYYKNGVWVQSGYNSTNALFSFGGGGGAHWYASNDGTGSWNVASAVVLWTATGVLQGASSRAWKENFTALKKPEILQKINRLNISRWNYKTEGAGITHIGPIAEDWAQEFGTGEDNKHIALIDEAGVALAGVQGLSQEQDQLKKKIEKSEAVHDYLFQWIKNSFKEVTAWLQDHDKKILKLQVENARLKEQNELILKRLDQLERRSPSSLTVNKK